MALYLTSASCQLLSQLYPLYPNLECDWLPALVWDDQLALLAPEVWSHWLPSTREKLGPIRLFLLVCLLLSILVAIVEELQRYRRVHSITQCELWGGALPAFNVGIDLNCSLASTLSSRHYYCEPSTG